MEMTVQESQLNNEMEQEVKQGPHTFIDAAGLPVREGSLEEAQEIHRNLATIQKIKSLTPIEGADKIELATMEDNRWQVVVQKIHKVGDVICYVEIESVVPSIPCFSFMEPDHYRVKTRRFKGQISQGLILPLRDFPEKEKWPLELLVGTDVTEILGVTKYEKPIPAEVHGKIRGNFPRSLVSITDEKRLQNCSRILEELRDIPVYITVKVDGTSATYINHDGETHVCSRKIDLKAPEEGNKPNAYWEIEQRYNITSKLKVKGNYAIQGEIAGEGINKNKMGLNGIDFFVFNVYNITEHRYLNFNEFLQFTKDLELKTVPILEYAALLNDKTFDDMLKMADGLYPNGTPREGIVVRPTEERYSNYMRGRVSFKIVSNEFLLKYRE